MSDDRIMSAITEMRADIKADMTTFRVAMMERFDRVEARFAQVRADIIVNMATADLAHKVADNTREEVRSLTDLVGAVIRKQQRLEARVDDLTKPDAPPH